MRARHPGSERISAFLGGDLSERDAVGIRGHVAQCATCAGALEELRQQVAAMSDLERPEPPVTMWAAIEGTWEREAAGHFGGTWSWRSLLVGAACGAAVVAAVVLVRLPVRAGGTASGPEGRLGEELVPRDPLLIEAENELGRAAAAYEQAAARLRNILEREQVRWDPVQRARVAERLVGLDEAVAHSRAVARRDPGDGAGAEMLFAAYQKQIDFLAEAVHRGSASLDEDGR